MKKLLSILMVLILVLSFGVNVFASEETGSITITNATIDETYAIYKIFDANISLNAEGKTIVSYSIKSDNQFFEALFGADGTKVNEFFIYHDNGSVRKNKDANDSELNKYLTDLVANGTYTHATTPIKATSSEVKFTGIEYGYYLITSSLGATVTINSNTPDVEVIDKNQEPGVDFDKQVQVGLDENGKPIWEDANSANIGDKITYQISFTATNYDGDKKIKHYQIHDEKGDAIWAEFNSIQVFVEGKELPRGYYLSQGGDPDSGTWLWLGDYDNTCSDGWDDVTSAEKIRDNAQWYLVHLGYDQFRITIPWLKNHQLKDITDESDNVISYSLTYNSDESKFDSPVDVVITYDAVIEPGASIGDTTHGNRFNKASASWTSEHETGSTPPDEVVTHVYGIGLLKDDSATGQNLAGAVFRIYRNYNKNTKKYSDPVYVIPTKTEGVYIVDSKGTPSETVTGSAMLDVRELYGANLSDYLKDLEGNPVEQNNIVVSQINGKLVIIGLKAGTYYLEEAKAPDGYNGLSVPVEIKAGEDIRPFYIYADEEGHVADVQEEDATHKEKKYDLTHTVVHNSQGQVLPSTGGEGTFWLITIGSLLTIGFAIFLITHKKMSVYTD